MYTLHPSFTLVRHRVLQTAFPLQCLPLVLHFFESHLEGHVIIDGMRDDGYDYVVAAACEHVGENE